MLICIHSFLFALSPTQDAALYDHLVEVNPRWQLVETDVIDFSRQISFADDIERIRMHLEMVEKLLLNTNNQHFSAEQLANRKRSLETLAIYRENRQYPLNSFHTERRPYFIDQFGTACAVGHLLQQSGQEDFASRIAREMNFSYLMEMPYPEIGTWAEENGFTKEELALIQPGYLPVVTWTSVGEGADGEITALYSDEDNQRLILAGDFNSLDGVSCKQVGTYTNGTFASLGEGVNGKVYAIAIFEGDIYVGGIFENGSHIAVWNGTNWSYERFGNGPVHALQVFNNVLFAGGEFIQSAEPSDSLSYIAKKESGAWQMAGNFNGSVYALSVHAGELYAGGNINPLTVSPYHVVRMTENGGWMPVANPLEALDNTVRSLTSDGTHLYAAGDCFDDGGNMTFGLARLGNSGWERLIDAQQIGLDRYSLKKVIFHEGAILVAGDYQLQPIVGIYGNGVSKLRITENSAYLEALSLVDSTVNAVASVGGELFLGGQFEQNGNETVNHLAKNQ